MDRPWLEDLLARGFDFSIHPNLPPPTHPLWERRLADHVRQFEGAYGRPPSPSVRNHAITWSGYLCGPRIEAGQGFTFDANYFSLLPQARYYMTGSGLPMPFADPSGEALPIFQLPTQFSDETTLGSSGWSLGLTPDEGVALVTGLMRQNAGGQHSMLCVNAHPVSFATYSAPLWEPVLGFAKGEGIPVLSVDRLSRFWHARRRVRLRPIPKSQVTGHRSRVKDQSRVQGQRQSRVEGYGPWTLDSGLATRDLTGVSEMSAMIPVEGPVAGQRTRTVGGRVYAVCSLTSSSAKREADGAHHRRPSPG
jgi:hypothetical protein